MQFSIFDQYSKSPPPSFLPLKGGLLYRFMMERSNPRKGKSYIKLGNYSIIKILQITQIKKYF